MQTCYENHNVVRIKSAYLGLSFQTIRGEIVDLQHSRGEIVDLLHSRGEIVDLLHFRGEMVDLVTLGAYSEHDPQFFKVFR